MQDCEMWYHNCTGGKCIGTRWHVVASESFCADMTWCKLKRHLDGFPTTLHCIFHKNAHNFIPTYFSP